MSVVAQNISGILFQQQHLISSERAMAMQILICIRNMGSYYESIMPKLSDIPDIPEQKIQWLNECLTLALPKSTDRLAALRMLLKRLEEDV